jgi:5-formyltetrahydrofolate cyclo-ligase
LPAPDPKNELRRRLRAQRTRLSPEERAAAARHLHDHVVATRLFLACRRIACYLPNNGEIDPRPIIERILRMNKTCYLPVLSRLGYDRLWFAPYAPGTALKPNRFDIQEPDVPLSRLVRARELDLILMPLVAVDRDGNRLGMGGGFYDRSLEFLRHRGRWHKPHLFGLAYDFQRLVDDRLPVQPWDIPLAGVATDRGVYLTANQ